METQTRFDLNAAIAEWQQELAGQPDLTPLVRRELETHLRDTVAELHGRGLNHEESYWLARRRVGQPEQLGEEFAKADPTKVWRERVFWMATALLVINLWGNFLNQFNRSLMNPRLMYSRVMEDILPGWVLFYLPHWLRGLHLYDAVLVSLQIARLIPILVLAVFVARGRLKLERTPLTYILASRARFVLTALGAFLIANWAALFAPQPGATASVFLFQFPWTFSWIALAAWLIPTKKGMTARAV